MQSNFKPRPASFIDEIKRDLRVATNAANHIIFMGYSFPPDDVEYRAFFAARRKRLQATSQAESGEKEPLCSVIIGRDHEDRWIEDPQELEELMRAMEKTSPPYTTL
ncbi:MAG TPA: hypothetical protein PLW97_13200, partial [Synergistaceae bacterium]|nr:hypothetical protein [Synergistaceae bacterium]